MEIYKAVILGIIQGLTEFLPVSSSGHLVIFQNFLKVQEPALFFDISVHFGTLCAVFIIFFKDIRLMISALYKFCAGFITGKKNSSEINEDKNLKFAFLIIAGSVPTAVIGLLLHTVSERLFSSIVSAGCMLLLTGVILWSTKNIKENVFEIKRFSFFKAFFIGIVQGLAVIPGISRSGSTIASALHMGIDRENAAKFSFLLSIPAILGAQILSIKDILSGAVVLDAGIIIGTVTAFITGYFSLILLIKIVKKGRLYFFAPYCIVIGIIALVFGYF